MLIYTHKSTNEEATIFSTPVINTGTPTPHVVLKRNGKPNLTITKREFERDWKIINQ